MYRIRHQLVLTFVLLLGTFALASAQGEQPGANDEPQDLPLLAAPSHMAAGEWEALTLEPVDASEVPVVPQLLQGSDTCTNAPAITVPGGAQSITNGMTNSASDPPLACMWGSPSNPQGYRTTWFKFTTPYSGRVTITTEGSNYDTVLAVYTGGCGSPTQLACNDDSNFFSSEVTISAFANQDYYIEVADWHLGVSGTATANIAAYINKESDWEIYGIMGLPRTRHSVAVLHDVIYVIAGQTVAFGNPERTPRVDRLNTATGVWTIMTSMPAGSDGQGYSNTSAAEVNAKIYLPSGYVGNNSIYDGTHWVYDIAGNTWSTTTPAPWAGGTPAIYHEAVAYTDGAVDGYYVAGGLTGPLPLTNPGGNWAARRELYFYNPSINIWFNRQPMATGRFGHTAGVQRIGIEDYICVVGGIGEDGNGDPLVLSAGECYDIDSDVWSITTGALNYPRYNAGSAVDGNGNWYVFGGTNNLGQSVAVTELYDRASNQWIALESRFNLGSEDPNEPLRPARAWPRGGFVDQTLWVVGGHRNTSFGDLVVNLVEHLFLPGENLYLPFFSHERILGEPDDTFGDSRRIIVGQTLTGAFHEPDDFVDVYHFDLSIPYSFTIDLTNFDVGEDYDLHLYTGNKVLLNSSSSIGAVDESIAGTLNPGRYYIVVERITPPPGSDPITNPYTISIR